MSKNNTPSRIDFSADKVYVHRWPLDSPIWDSSVEEKLTIDLNKNTQKKKIRISEKKIQINDYAFLQLKKIGITVPLFKKETTMVFEGKFDDLDAHIHITATPDYLEIFNKLMTWKQFYFPD